MTIIEQGGADWELGEAARKLTTALGGGDAAALEAAMRDHAAAVGSKSTQMIAALFTPLMAGQQQTRDDIAELAKQVTTSDVALGTLVTTMQHIATTVVNIAEAQKKTDARIAHLEQRMDKSDGERASLGQRLARIEARLEARGDD